MHLDIIHLSLAYSPLQICIRIFSVTLAYINHLTVAPFSQRNKAHFGRVSSCHLNRAQSAGSPAALNWIMAILFRAQGRTSVWLRWRGAQTLQLDERG